MLKRVNNKRDGNEDWCDLEKKLSDVASNVCGYIKGKLIHFEAWGWNKYADVTVCRKRELFRIWKQSRNEKIGRNIVRQKKMLGEEYIWLWIRKLGRL